MGSFLVLNLKTNMPEESNRIKQNIYIFPSINEYFLPYFEPELFSYLNFINILIN